MAAQCQNTTSCIYVVATPIGNLGDLSGRAREILQQVDIVAAEDTRRARQLFMTLHLGSPSKSQEFVSYYDQVEEQRTADLIGRLSEQVLSLALISDAGTPGIADPGYRLTRAAHAAGIPVIPIPGPSAPMALASAAGLATNRLLFVGFLPRQKEALRSEVEGWKELWQDSVTAPSILCLESTQRLKASLGELRELVPEARVAVGRELTKLHEEIVVGTSAALLLWAEAHTHLKGEVVLMIEPAPPEPEDQSAANRELQRRIALCKARGLSQRDLLEVFASERLSRKKLYDLILLTPAGDGSS